MFQFPEYGAFAIQVLQIRFSHSEIAGSTLAYNSPTLIAESHVLHRLLVPWHPPYALTYLTILLILNQIQTRWLFWEFSMRRKVWILCKTQTPRLEVQSVEFRAGTLPFRQGDLMQEIHFRRFGTSTQRYLIQVLRGAYSHYYLAKAYEPDNRLDLVASANLFNKINCKNFIEPLLLRSASSKTDLRFGYISCKRSCLCLFLKKIRAANQNPLGGSKSRFWCADFLGLQLQFAETCKLHHDRSQWESVCQPCRHHLRIQWLVKIALGEFTAVMTNL